MTQPQRSHLGVQRIATAWALLATLTTSAWSQPRACMANDRPRPPLATAQVRIADRIIGTPGAPYALAYATDLAYLQKAGRRAQPYDDGGLNSPWAQFDQPLNALLIGVSVPIELVIDSVRAEPSRTRVFITTWCAGSARTRLGHHWISALGDTAHVRFRTALVDVALARPPITVGNGRVFAASGVQLDSANIARRMAIMNDVATELSVLRPQQFDIIITQRTDTMLAVTGIVDWVSPIAEYTSDPGPLSVMQNDKGNVSYHELVHVFTMRLPMHWLLREGLAVYLAGALDMSLDALACAERTPLAPWRGAELTNFLRTGRNSAGEPPTDRTSAALGGLLAKVLVENNHPRMYLNLTPLTLQMSDVGQTILRQWESQIQKAIAVCSH